MRTAIRQSLLFLLLISAFSLQIDRASLQNNSFKDNILKVNQMEPNLPYQQSFLSNLSTFNQSKTKGVRTEKSTIPAGHGKKLWFKDLLKANIKFTENKGQLERFQHFNYSELGDVKFYSKAFCGNAYFGTRGIGFGFQRLAFREAQAVHNDGVREFLSPQQRRETLGFSISFKECRNNVNISGISKQTTVTNFLKGNNPENFITDVASFEQIEYQELYNKIDLRYYNKGGELKYDYIIKPHAQVSNIKMEYDQVDKLHINSKGELEIDVKWGTLIDKAPYSYQIINGVKKTVNVTYHQIEAKTIGFKIQGKYDPSKELVIDPFTVSWSTYIGTATSDDGYLEATCIDNSGRVYGTGWTNNSFPINASPNGYDKTANGGTDAYVFRLNSAGTAIDYISYLGGSNNEVGTGILINSAGEICVSGHTASYGAYTFLETSITNLTVATGTVNVNVASIASYGFGATILLNNGLNALTGTITQFVNATTLEVNITSVVGSGTFNTWALSRVDLIPFPTTATAIQPLKTGNDGNDDIFYAKLNGAGNNMTYSTLYGGTASQMDWAIDLALDKNDNAYIVGRTQTSSGFGTGGAYKSAAQGGYDGFVLKINNNGTLGYCSYIGGTGDDIAKGIDVNGAGEVFVTGMTSSAGQGTVGSFRPNLTGGDDAYLIKLTSLGTLGFFTYFGGSARDCGSDIDLIQSSSESVIVGTTNSTDFPLLNALDNINVAGEGFLVRFNASGSAVKYSTFVGGDGSDNSKGNDYTTIHKNGGVKLSANNQPFMVFAMASSTASMSSFLVDPVSFSAVNQAGSAYMYNGNAYRGNDDFLLTVFDSTAQNVLFGSYFGGTDNDYPTAGINILQSSGCVVFGGGVHSLPFPVTAGAFQTLRVNSVIPDQPTIMKVCLPEILPVEFLDFKLNDLKGKVQVTWTSINEVDNDYFEVLRSVDGIHFTVIGSVKGNGTTTSISKYSFVDESYNSGVVYYKIKQVDFSGQIDYSGVKSVNINLIENVQFLINSENIGILNAYLQGQEKVELSITSILGSTLEYRILDVPEGNLNYELDLKNYAKGVYLISLITINQLKTFKFIKE